MRLFTALWPSSEASRHLSGAVQRVPARRWDAATERVRGFRLLPERQWHLTLCFHGDADPDALGDRLEEDVWQLSQRDPGLGGLRLRLAGAGTFRGVLWVGVRADGAESAETFRGLVLAAGSDTDTDDGHLTIARWNRGRPDRTRLTAPLADYRGPWWTADAVALVGSERTAEGVAYRTVRSVGLTHRRSGDEGGHQQP